MQPLAGGCSDSGISSLRSTGDGMDRDGGSGGSEGDGNAAVTASMRAWVDAILSVCIWVRHPDDGGKGGECAGGAVYLARRSPAEGAKSRGLLASISGLLSGRSVTCEYLRSELEGKWNWIDLRAIEVEKAILAEAQETGQILDEEKLDLDAYDSDCDDVSNAKAILMANLSTYGSVISEVPHSEPYHNDMNTQSSHALQDFKETPVFNFTDNKITSDSNIILYSQYFQETQQATVQDTNFHAQQDLMILSVVKRMLEQMINHVNNWEKANKEKNNESVTAELERYKERVKTF
ncbi:hypothetical protein Tco_1146238 [Tanacetum coccineum]